MAFANYPLTGRRKIYSSAKTINAENVLDVLALAKRIHDTNKSEIEYLYEYFKGNQPIYNKENKIRPDINNIIAENRANEIVSFKVGYLCGEPIQYVGREGQRDVTDKINKLNDMMFFENKSMKDKQLVEWQTICGTGYRMALASNQYEEGGSPFEIYTLDPRDTFVVYSTAVGEKPLMGVTIWRREIKELPGQLDFPYTDAFESSQNVYNVYTPTEFFEISDNKIKDKKDNNVGMIPVIEYPANDARLGAFETVLPVLDAINTLQSNRVDSVVQNVQAIYKFVNCEIDTDNLAKMLAMGAVMIKSVDGNKADVDVIKNDLDQSQIQNFVDSLYQDVLTMCGIPNRNGGSSTSDTGSAVLLRDGWSLAESNAKSAELMFKGSEREFLKVVLKICKNSVGLDLSLRDIEQKFTRRNYENIQVKAQVLATMLQQDKIHPLLAFSHCGMFSDPEGAYAMSKEYYDDLIEQMAQEPHDLGEAREEASADKTVRMEKEN